MVFPLDEVRLTSRATRICVYGSVGIENLAVCLRRMQHAADCYMSALQGA